MSQSVRMPVSNQLMFVNVHMHSYQPRGSVFWARIFAYGNLLLAISFLLRHDLCPSFFPAADFCNRRQEVGIVCGFPVPNCRGKAFGMLPHFLTVRFFPSALPLALSKKASNEVGGPGRQPMQHTDTHYLKTAHHRCEPIIHAKALRSPSRSAPGRKSGPGFGHEHVSNYLNQCPSIKTLNFHIGLLVDCPKPISTQTLWVRSKKWSANKSLRITC